MGLHDAGRCFFWPGASPGRLPWRPEACPLTVFLLWDTGRLLTSHQTAAVGYTRADISDFHLAYRRCVARLLDLKRPLVALFRLHKQHHHISPFPNLRSRQHS